MNDKDLEKYIDKALAEFKAELLDHNSIPVLLLAVEVEKEDEVISLCTRYISCEKVLRCLRVAINNCRKEMIDRKFQKNILN
jgi:hypothetical protein